MSPTTVSILPPPLSLFCRIFKCGHPDEFIAIQIGKDGEKVHNMLPREVYETHNQDEKGLVNTVGRCLRCAKRAKTEDDKDAGETRKKKLGAYQAGVSSTLQEDRAGERVGGAQGVLARCTQLDARNLAPLRHPRVSEVEHRAHRFDLLERASKCERKFVAVPLRRVCGASLGVDRAFVRRRSSVDVDGVGEKSVCTQLQTDAERSFQADASPGHRSGNGLLGALLELDSIRGAATSHAYITEERSGDSKNLSLIQFLRGEDQESWLERTSDINKSCPSQNGTLGPRSRAATFPSTKPDKDAPFPTERRSSNPGISPTRSPSRHHSLHISREQNPCPPNSPTHRRASEDSSAWTSQTSHTTASDMSTMGSTIPPSQDPRSSRLPLECVGNPAEGGEPGHKRTRSTPVAKTEVQEVASLQDGKHSSEECDLRLLMRTEARARPGARRLDLDKKLPALPLGGDEG